jgi:hypothetical protein
MHHSGLGGCEMKGNTGKILLGDRNKEMECVERYVVGYSNTGKTQRVSVQNEGS